MINYPPKGLHCLYWLLIALPLGACAPSPPIETDKGSVRDVLPVAEVVDLSEDHEDLSPLDVPVDLDLTGQDETTNDAETAQDTLPSPVDVAIPPPDSEPTTDGDGLLADAPSSDQTMSSADIVAPDTTDVLAADDGGAMDEASVDDTTIEDTQSDTLATDQESPLDQSPDALPDQDTPSPWFLYDKLVLYVVPESGGCANNGPLQTPMGLVLNLSIDLSGQASLEQLPVGTSVLSMESEIGWDGPVYTFTFSTTNTVIIPELPGVSAGGSMTTTRTLSLVNDSNVLTATGTLETVYLTQEGVKQIDCLELISATGTAYDQLQP